MIPFIFMAIACALMAVGYRVTRRQKQVAGCSICLLADLVMIGAWIFGAPGYWKFVAVPFVFFLIVHVTALSWSLEHRERG